MKLTIAMLFCDKDCHLAEKLSRKVLNCTASISDKEIILLDNREKNTDKLNFDIPIKVFKAGKNLYQLQGRKYLINKATGDYIWFIDADDEIYYIDQEIPSLMGKYDTIIFSYIYGSAPFGQWKEKEFKPGENIADKYGAMAWNKWFRTSLLKKIEEEYVPDDLNVIASEDLILVVGASVLGNGAIYVPSIIYKFNVENSQSGCNHISNIETLKHIMMGHKEANEILKNICKNTKFDIESIEKNDANFFLYKVSQCSGDIMRDALDIVLKEFDLPILQKAFQITQYWADPVDSVKLYYLLNSKFPDKFSYWLKDAVDNKYVVLTMVNEETGDTNIKGFNDIINEIH